MDPAIVDDLHPIHLVTSSLEDTADAVPEKVVAQVSEVERLVGVRGTVLYHHLLTSGGEREQILSGGMVQELQPIAVRDHHVQKALHHVEPGHDGEFRLNELAEGGRGRLGTFAAHLQEWEHVDGDVTLELRSCGLEGDGLGIELVIEKALEGRLNGGQQLGLKTVLEHGVGCKGNVSPRMPGLRTTQKRV